MLFLAVFCGFLAEYQLEHMIERNREKQFMITMVDDLKSDTTQLTRLIRTRKTRIIGLDTLFTLIASDEYLKMGRKVYDLYDNPYWDILRFFPSDRTMQQLKNGASMRLIRNKEVSDALIRYDVYVRNYKEYEPLQAELAGQLNQHIEKLIDPVIIENAKRKSDFEQLDADTVINRNRQKWVFPDYIEIINLADADKKIILKYISQVKSIYLAMMRDNMGEKKIATQTLSLIQKAYHLD